MRSPFGVVDVIREGTHVFEMTFVVLQRDDDLNIILLAENTDDIGIKEVFRPVEVLHEFRNTIFVMEFIGLICSFIDKLEPNAWR